MATMRAAVFTGAGGAASIEIREAHRPEPPEGHALVRVRATALNRADLLQRDGRYPPPRGAPRDIAGLEFAGEVAALGTGVRLVAAGDRVFGLSDGGAHAEYLAVPEALLVRIPDALDWIHAAAAPEACITAHDALITQAYAGTGARVLIHAVGSGVGTAAVQIARAFGMVPFGTTRTAEKLERARDLGLEAGVALENPAALRDEVSRWTDDGMVDVVLDLLGGPYTEASIQVLAPLGRLVLIGLIAGGEARLPLGQLLRRRLTLRGTVLRSRSLDEKASATALFARDVVPMLERGEVRAIVDSCYPLDAMREAHLRMESNESFGKIVIMV